MEQQAMEQTPEPSESNLKCQYCGKGPKGSLKRSFASMEGKTEHENHCQERGKKKGPEISSFFLASAPTNTTHRKLPCPRSQPASQAPQHYPAATQVTPLAAPQDVSTTPEFKCCGYRPPGVAHPLVQNLALGQLRDLGIASLDLINDTIKSKDCLTVAARSGGSCNVCANLQYNQSLKKIVDRGIEPQQLSARHSDLSLQQMTEKVKTVQADKVYFKQRFCRSLKKIMKLESRISTHDRLLREIASNNIPRLRALLVQRFKRGASIEAICRDVHKAAQGLIHVKGYTGDEHDLGWLFKHIGGGALLHAANRAGLVPSSRTLLKSSTRRTMLLNAHESPLQKCVDHNMRNIIGKDFFENVGERRSIITLKTDEVAVDQRVRWDPGTDTVVGLVGAQVPDGDTGKTKVEFHDRSFATYSQALILQKKFDRGQLQLANEASVFALGASDATNYSARVLSVLPFKKTSATSYSQKSNMVSIIEFVNSNPLMQKAGAKVDVVASDGDSQRRQAMLSYMSILLSETHGPQIYSILKDLPLFDLHVGPNFEVYMLDEKHRWKRLRGMLISLTRRICIGPVTVDRDMLWSLLLATGVPEKDIKSVFEVQDKQNVLKAMLLLHMLAQCDFNRLTSCESTTDSSRRMSREALLVASPSLKVVTFLCEAMIMPAIDVDMSLSRQLEYASALAHTMYFLQAKHGTHFLPNQQAYDFAISCMSLYAIVAKAQVRDPSGNTPIYIMSLGTDELEKLFGMLRSQNHNRGFDILELHQKISSAADHVDILKRHPNWAPTGKNRLSTKSKHWDHLTPRNWKGDVTAGSANLRQCWENGRGMSIQLLGSVEGFEHVSDVFCFERANQGATLIRPDGKTPYGVTCLDCDSDDEHHEGVDAAGNQEVQHLADDEEHARPEWDRDSLFDWLGCLEALEESNECAEIRRNSASGHIMSSEELQCRIDRGTASSLTDSSPNFNVNGKMVWKASAARIMFDEGTPVLGRNERLMRVRGFTESATKTAGTATGRLVEQDSSDDSFVQGDLFATLVVGKTVVGGESIENVCLCVCVADNIITASTSKNSKKKKQVHSSIESTNLSSATIQFNVVHLIEQEQNAVNSEAGKGRLWAGRPVLTRGEVAGQQIVPLSSRLLYDGDKPWTFAPNPSSFEHEVEEDEMELGGGRVGDKKTMFLFALEEQELQAALEVLEVQRGVCSENVSASGNWKLPHFVSSAYLPYTDLEGSCGFIAENQTGAKKPTKPAAPKSPAYVKCSYPMCNVSFESNNWNKLRQHVAKHILQETDSIERCGMCGSASKDNAACSLVVTSGRGSSSSISVDMAGPGVCTGYPLEMRKGGSVRWGSHQNSSMSSPSTNSPLQCKECPTVTWVWKYNMPAHYKAVHLHVECPADFLVNDLERERVLAFK